MSIVCVAVQSSIVIPCCVYIYYCNGIYLFIKIKIGNIFSLGTWLCVSQTSEFRVFPQIFFF